MFALIARIFTSPIMRILFRLIASLASALLVISGYLLFLSNRRSDEEEPLRDRRSKLEKTETEPTETDETDKNQP